MWHIQERVWHLQASKNVLPSCFVLVGAARLASKPFFPLFLSPPLKIKA
jgi:hypothetical protein